MSKKKSNKKKKNNNVTVNNNINNNINNKNINIIDNNIDKNIDKNIDNKNIDENNIDKNNIGKNKINKNKINNNKIDNNKIDSKVENNSNNSSSKPEALMDFSKIDDEYKGELRRKLSPKDRFFRTCEKFGDLFLLNVFFTLTSIPIVTIGASFTALYTITLKMVRNEDVPIKDGYFKAFKQNFKQATQLWLILLGAFIFIRWQLVQVMGSNSTKMDFLVMVIGLELLLLTFVVPLLFPFVARYKNTNFNMLKNSLFASILHLGTWATVFFLWMIPVAIYYIKPKYFFYTWYLWLIFLSGFVAYTCSYRLRSMFDKIEETEAEDISEKADQANKE